MFSTLRPAIVILALFTILTGIVYPLAMTGIAATVFPATAGGSAIVKDGKVVGSALIGQAFTSDRYFQGRPSAAGTSGYDASASSGSNLGPLSAKLLDRVKADADKLRQQGASNIPADAVTASGSGLDPHISPAFAAIQVARVAQARGVPEDRVQAIVASHTKPAEWGFIGAPRVNVLRLNLALDDAFGSVSR